MPCFRQRRSRQPLLLKRPCRTRALHLRQARMRCLPCSRILRKQILCNRRPEIPQISLRTTLLRSRSRRILPHQIQQHRRSQRPTRVSLQMFRLRRLKALLLLPIRNQHRRLHSCRIYSLRSRMRKMFRLPERMPMRLRRRTILLIILHHRTINPRNKFLRPLTSQHRL